MKEDLPTQTTTFETTDPKLSALLLSVIADSFFRVYPPKENSKLKVVKVFYPDVAQAEVNNTISEYLSKQAVVGLFIYNLNLGKIRDEMFKGERDARR